jgi:hypothetical protein
LELFVQAPAGIRLTSDAYTGFVDAPKCIRPHSKLAALDGVRFSATLRDGGERLLRG